MTNEEIVDEFLSCYRKHDFVGMQRCLDAEVVFSDMAFDNIKGPQVRAMWHWFCVKCEPRKEPVEVPSFEIVGAKGDVVDARYRVRYLYGGKRPVDYTIKAELTLRGGKIVRHADAPTIPVFQFAKMAFGYPLCVLAFTPLFSPVVRYLAGKKLKQFIDSQNGLYG